MLEPGTLLDGRYQIHDKLGEGGMGSVYRATHVLMGKPCAIKILHPTAAVRHQAGKRFQREAQSASRLDHDNCIRVTDFGVTGDHLMYLVMELLDGRTLAAELEVHGALPIARVVAFARQVAAALAHAHGLGLVHRDLKPDNIFVVRGDVVKVLDFGLAKVLEGGKGRRGTLSEVGTVFGTPEYMSPEQAEGRELDPRTDLYSFGILLYQMMTGMLPFQGPNFMATLGMHLTQEPLSPAARRPDLTLPPSLVDLALRCLEKDPARRPASAAAVIDVLAALAPEPEPAPAPAPSLPRVPARVAAQETVELSEPIEPMPAPARSWPFYVLLAAPLITGLAILWMATRHGPAPAVATPALAPVPAPAPTPAPASAPAPVRVAVTALPPPVREAAPAGPTAADHLREAERAHRAGNRIKELYHLQQAVRVDPQSREAALRLGAALVEDGQRDLGCQSLARAGKIAESLMQSAGCQAPGGH